MRPTRTHPPQREYAKARKLARSILDLWGPGAQIDIKISYPEDDNSFHLTVQNPQKMPK